MPNFYSKILTFPVKDEGNSASNLLLSPNLQKQNLDCTKIIVTLIHATNYKHLIILSGSVSVTAFISGKHYLLLREILKTILTNKNTPLYTD